MTLRCSSMTKIIDLTADCSNNPKEIKRKNEYKTDIKSMKKPQLLELLYRQNRIINNLTLEKLPDKGEKVKKFKKEIEDELEKIEKLVDVSDALALLSINEKNIDVVEWGENNISPSKKNQLLNDEIIDVQNPLAILATHSGTNYNQKKIIVETEEEPLITLADIEELYALNLCNKIDKTEPTKKFLPHKTLVSNSMVFKNKVRDLSAATPPLPVYGDAKFITLDESLKLQFEHTKHLKEVQLKHATERLKGMRFKMGDTLPSGESTRNYRDNPVDQYSEEEEVHGSDIEDDE